MANSRSTRVSSMSNRTPWTAPPPRPAASMSAAESAQAGQGGILAQDDHGLEQRRGDPPARDSRADRAERQARLDAEAFHEGFLQGGLDVLGRPVGNGLQGGQGGVEHLGEILRQALA